MSETVRIGDATLYHADWLAVFRQAVREDWLHVWRSLPDGSNVLTTVGEQLRRAA